MASFRPRRPDHFHALCGALTASLLGCLGNHAAHAAQETWILDATANVGGHATTQIGSPTVVPTLYGAGLQFDGNDGLIVDANPIAGAAQFTVEMLVRLNPNPGPPLDQPRILHIQSNAPNDHRVTLEGRLTGSQWYVDAFLRAQSASNPSTIGSLTLIDATKLHPAGPWHSYALVYDGAQMRAYLNGQLELTGALAVLPVAPGRTSLGMRINQVNFFSGDIAKVRFSTTALTADELLSNRVPGDYDGDYFDPGGGVAGGDIAVWTAQFGAASGLPNWGDNADGDLDGDVDGADFLFWQRRVGVAPPATQPAPEPASGALLGAAALAAICPRRPGRAVVFRTPS